MEVAKEDVAMGASVRMVRNRRNSRDRVALPLVPHVVAPRTSSSLPLAEASLSSLGSDASSRYPAETEADRATAGRRRLRLADWEKTLGLSRDTLRDTEGDVATAAARLTLRTCEFAMSLVAERGDVDGAMELLPRAFAAAKQADGERERRAAAPQSALEETEEAESEQGLPRWFVAPDAPPLEADVWSAKASVYLERSRQLKRARDAAAAKMTGGVVGGAASGTAGAADGRQELQEALKCAERAVELHAAHARRLQGRRRDAESVLNAKESVLLVRERLRSSGGASQASGMSWAPRMATATPGELFSAGLLQSSGGQSSVGRSERAQSTARSGESAVERGLGVHGSTAMRRDSAVSAISAHDSEKIASIPPPSCLRPGEVLTVIAQARAHLNLCACLSTANRHAEALAHADTARRRMRRLLVVVWGAGAAPSGRRVDAHGAASIRPLGEHALLFGPQGPPAEATVESEQEDEARRLLRSLGVSVALAACFNAGAELEHLAQPWVARMRYQEGVGIAAAAGVGGFPLAVQLEAAAASLHFAKPAPGQAGDAADDALDELWEQAEEFARRHRSASSSLAVPEAVSAPSLLQLVNVHAATPRGETLAAPVTQDFALAEIRVSELRRASIHSRTVYDMPQQILPPPRHPPRHLRNRRRSSVGSFLPPIPEPSQDADVRWIEPGTLATDADDADGDSDADSDAQEEDRDEEVVDGVPHHHEDSEGDEDGGKQWRRRARRRRERKEAAAEEAARKTREATYGASGVRPKFAGILAFTGAAAASAMARKQMLKGTAKGDKGSTGREMFRPLTSVPDDASLGSGKSRMFDGASSLTEWMERERIATLRRERLRALRSRKQLLEREAEVKDLQVAPDTVFVAEKVAPALAPVLRAGMTPLLRKASIQPSPDILLVGRTGGIGGVGGTATSPGSPGTAQQSSSTSPFPEVVGNVGATLSGTRNAAMPLLWWRMPEGEKTMRPVSSSDEMRKRDGVLLDVPHLLTSAAAVELGDIPDPDAEVARRRQLRAAQEALEDQVDELDRTVDPEHARDKPRLRPSAGGVRRSDAGWQILMGPVQFRGPARQFEEQTASFGNPHVRPGRNAQREARIIRTSLKAEVAERERDDVQRRVALQDASETRTTVVARRDADRIFSIAAAAAASGAQRPKPALRHGIVTFSAPLKPKPLAFDTHVFARAKQELQTTLQDFATLSSRQSSLTP